MQCPACQERINPNTKFCAKCGQKIPRCPTCGDVITRRSRYCGKDGTVLPREVLDLLPETPAPQIPKAPPVQQPPRQPVQRQTQRKFCAKCGRECTNGQTICDACKAAQMRTGKDTASNRRSMTVLLVVLLAVAILLLTGIACYVAFSGDLPFSGSHDEQMREPDARPSEEQQGTIQTERPQYEPEEETAVFIVPETEPVVTVPPATIPMTQPPTEAPTEPEVDEDARVLYFINNCDSRYLTAADLEGFDENMCRIARNSIYAKSGRKFNDASLQAYFEQYDWYVPSVDPASFTAGMLNDYQNANLNLIMNYESDHGYR